ncbi:MAG: pitrilysin family protein [Patescibacteria group bacterium]
MEKVFYKKSDLGFKFLGVPKRGESSVTLFVLVKAGAVNESPENFGVAHFLEHMFSKGTKNAKTSLELSRRIDRIGGDYNAGTSFEYTIYHVNVPANKIKFGIFDLADKLKNSLFPETELEKEKGVILEEFRMYLDDPKSRIDDYMNEVIFGSNTGLGHNLAGTEKTILGMTRKNLVDFFNSNYKNSNVLVGAVGKFNPEKTLKFFEEIFGGFEKNENIQKEKNETKIFLEEKLSKPRIAILNDKETMQAHFTLGFRVPGKIDPDQFVFKVLDNFLGGTMSSRLFVKLREKLGICYYVYSKTKKYKDIGSSEISAGTDKSRFLKSLKGVVSEIIKIKDGKISAKDLRIAKTNLEGRLKLLSDDAEYIWNLYASQYLYDKQKIYSISDMISEIKKVSKEDLIRVARKYFTKENCYFCVTHDKITEEEILKVLEF